MVSHPEVLRLAGGIILVDIQDYLPVHSSKKYPLRKKNATTLFVHHSGVDNGRDGIEVARIMATYHVNNRNWPGIGYQYVIPYRADRPYKNELVIYKVGSESTVRAHTKLCNKFGTGICLQGDLNKQPISPSQIECLEAFIPIWMRWNGRDPTKDLGWHSNSWKWLGLPKFKCPGKNAVKWLEEYVRLSAGWDKRVHTRVRLDVPVKVSRMVVEENWEDLPTPVVRRRNR